MIESDSDQGEPEASEPGGAVSRCVFVPCCQCGQFVLYTDTPLERSLGAKRKCLLCLRARLGGPDAPGAEERAALMQSFLNVFPK